MILKNTLIKPGKSFSSIKAVISCYGNSFIRLVVNEVLLGGYLEDYMVLLWFYWEVI